MYEYIDLTLITISLLLCGLSLHRGNRDRARLKKLENLVIASTGNPKLSRKLLNEFIK